MTDTGREGKGKMKRKVEEEKAFRSEEKRLGELKINRKNKDKGRSK